MTKKQIKTKKEDIVNYWFFEQMIDECDVVITADEKIFEDILEGRVTFQRAFMAGSIKMKGDFKLLRSMDQLFNLKAE